MSTGTVDISSINDEYLIFSSFAKAMPGASRSKSTTITIFMLSIAAKYLIKFVPP